jgi:phage-related protein
MPDLVLQLLLKLKDEASAALKGAEKNVSGLNLTAIALGGAAVAGVAMLAKGLWDCAKAAGEEEVGIARLSAAVKASGGSWKVAQGAIENYLSAELRRVALDDGAGRESIARLTTATGSYTDALAMMPGVLDLAAGAFKGELEPATKAVMLALDGNMASLNKLGLELPKTATQVEILAEIQKKFGGQAEAYGNTFEGSQKKMSIAMGNIKETIGAALLPALTDLITKFSDIAVGAMPTVQRVIETAGPIIGAVFTAIGSALSAVWGIVQPIFVAIAAWWSGEGTTMAQGWQASIEVVFGSIKTTIETILGGLKTFWDTNGAEITAIVTAVFGGIQLAIETVMGLIKTGVETVLGGLKTFWETNGTEITSIVNTVWTGLKTAIEVAWTLIKGVIDTALALFKGDWQAAWDGVKGIIDTVWVLIKDGIDTALGLIKGVIDLAWEGIKGAASVAWDGIKDAISGKWDEIKTAVNDKLTSVKDAISTAWDNIKETISTSWDTIKGAISGKWDEIKTAVDGKLTAVKDAIKTAWDDIWTKAQTDWGTIRGSITIAWGGIRTDIDIAIAAVKTNVSNAWADIKKVAAEKWSEIQGTIWKWVGGEEGWWTKIFAPTFNSVRTELSKWVTGIRNSISTLLDNIKIKTPHITVNYTDVLLLGRIPTGISVTWAGRGADFITSGPQLIGVGERGAERVQVTPLGGGRGGGGGGISFTFVYAPVISLANEREAYEQIAPVIREVLRRENRR